MLKYHICHLLGSPLRNKTTNKYTKQTSSAASRNRSNTFWPPSSAWRDMNDQVFGIIGRNIRSDLCHRGQTYCFAHPFNRFLVIFWNSSPIAIHKGKLLCCCCVSLLSFCFQSIQCVWNAIFTLLSEYHLYVTSGGYYVQNKTKQNKTCEASNENLPLFDTTPVLSDNPMGFLHPPSINGQVAWQHLSDPKCCDDDDH